MDVRKSKKQKATFGSKYKLVGIAIVVLSVAALYMSQVGHGTIVKRGEVLIGTIKQGDVDVTIEGYGVLTSNKQQLITTLTRATVKEIVLKPGAVVTTDSVIVKLENPELEQQLRDAKQELALMQANLRQLKTNHKRESLQESVKISERLALYEATKLKREAEATLVESGMVSRLVYSESVLNEKQLKQQFEILTESKKQLKDVHTESINIELERIKQYQGRVDIAQERLDKLQVRSGLDGVLQRLSVELGQSLIAGQEIALIGSVTELIAMIKVPQNQASQVVEGQKTIIDTRADKIEGTVVRIDPAVVDNTVSIEIALLGALPQSARPQLSVDARIIVQTLTDISYIERPANIQANSDNNIYQLSDDQSQAQLKKLQFGRKAGRYIEVVAGATVGDQFILSDMSSLASQNEFLSIHL